MHTPEEYENLLNIAKSIIEELEFCNEKDFSNKWDWQSDIHLFCPFCGGDEEHRDDCIIKFWKDLL